MSKEQKYKNKEKLEQNENKIREGGSWSIKELKKKKNQG